MAGVYEVGAFWVNADGTTTDYPTNGKGGSTTTAANSMLATADEVVIEGIQLVTVHTAATTINIRNSADDATILAIDVPLSGAGLGHVGKFIPVGIHGVVLRGGDAHFGVASSNAGTTAYVFFRVVRYQQAA